MPSHQATVTNTGLRGLLFAAAVAFAGSAAANTPAPPAPVLAGTPHLLGRGVISDSDSVANATFTPDGKTIYFSKHNPGWAHITIVESHHAHGHWMTPQVAPFSGFWRDTDPHVSPDGRKLFFASNRPVDGGRTPNSHYDIWIVERVSGGAWGSPKRLESSVNAGAGGAYPSVTRDGTLYFEAQRNGRPAIFRSEFKDGAYGPPEPLPFCDTGGCTNPVISSDDRFIVFFATDRGGLGGADLFVSFHRADGRWSKPVNLGPAVNSPSFESAPGLSPDNRTLYFSSDRIDPAPRMRRVTYAELERELHGDQNGLSKIYAMDISDLDKLDPGG